MSDNYRKACVEVLEILKYLDNSIYEKIPKDKIEELNYNKDSNYIFNINKNIPLYENDFMNETISILNELLDS